MQRVLKLSTPSTLSILSYCAQIRTSPRSNRVSPSSTTSSTSTKAASPPPIIGPPPSNLDKIGFDCSALQEVMTLLVSTTEHPDTVIDLSTDADKNFAAKVTMDLTEYFNLVSHTKILMSMTKVVARALKKLASMLVYVGEKQTTDKSSISGSAVRMNQYCAIRGNPRSYRPNLTRDPEPNCQNAFEFNLTRRPTRTKRMSFTRSRTFCRSIPQLNASRRPVAT